MKNTVDLASDGVKHLKKLTPSNTIVIASSVSNGAGAALAAAEQDTQGLISGVAVAEPEVQLAPDSRLSRHARCHHAGWYWQAACMTTSRWPI